VRFPHHVLRRARYNPCLILRPRGCGVRQLFFGVILVYSWALSMFIGPEALLASTRGSALYIAIVAPAVCVVLANIDCFFAARYDRGALALAAFAVIVTLVSLMRGDLPTVISVFPLCVTLIAIHNARLAPTVGLINGLFIASIVGTLTLQVLGLPRYGVIPGYSPDVAWRISLFPYNVTPSWLFSLVVIFTNYFRNPKPIARRAMIAVALYFIAFSASRTSLIVLMMTGAFLALTQLWRFRNRRLFRWLLPASVGLFVIFLSTQALLTLLVGVDDPLLNAVLFRSEAGASDVDAATTSIYRTIIWGAHLDAFLNNPLFGLGTMNFADLALGTEDVTGSESFLTGLFGRTGSLALLFVYFIYRNAVDATNRGDRFVYCLMILFALTSLTYGSYIVPYDFIFLVLFSAMNIGPAGRAPEVTPDSSGYRSSLTNSA
jgi:hypothetical protein